jgi:hypothetical protein
MGSVFMSSTEAKIVNAARAWVLALRELEEVKQQAEMDAEQLRSAELAIHTVAARTEALKNAELALYRAVQLSGTTKRKAKVTKN